MADTIVFRGGRTREGQILSETETQIVFKDTVNNQTISLDKANIVDIRRGAGAPSSNTLQTAASVQALAEQGKSAEALKASLDAVKANPAAAAELSSTFQKATYDLLDKAQKSDAANQTNEAYAAYRELYIALADPASAGLSGAPTVAEQFRARAADGVARANIKYADQLTAANRPADAAARLQEAVQVQPTNAAARLALAKAALASNQPRIARDQLEALGRAGNLTPEQQAQVAELSKQFIAVAANTPVPTPISAPPAPNIVPPTNVSAPVVASAPTPTPAIPTSADEDIPFSKRATAYMSNLSVSKLVADIGSLVSGNEFTPIVLIVVGVWFVFWFIPKKIITAMARKGDMVASQIRPIVGRMGIFAFIPYFLKRRGSNETPKNACPSCGKALDNIESYTDMNFVACPHCQAPISPVYDLKQYIDHLSKQLATQQARAKGGAVMEGTIERDTMTRLFRSLLTQSVRARASDIHIESEAESAKIRHRVDGVMYDAMVLPKSVANAMISSIKIMANLDITERRVPQDGQVSLTIDKQDLDLRLNTSPSANGEKVAIRVLNHKLIMVDPARLGMEGEHLAKFQAVIRRPHGLVIVTGPSGSGKSTSLYVALNDINTGDKNIITLEDPIEYHLRGLTQMQVNTAANFTFATGLRSLLRQDPDVIMVGEVRDSETADIAIEAAMTGHLVFTTLHTIDAPTAFSRLSDLGVETKRLAASVICVLAQRLLRTNCPSCSRPYKPRKADLDLLNIDPELPPFEFMQGPGCDECMNTGYFGRTGLFEFLVPDQTMREVLEANASVSVIREIARRSGYRTLREEGIIKIVQGRTSVEEVLRVTS